MSPTACAGRCLCDARRLGEGGGVGFPGGIGANGPGRGPGGGVGGLVGLGRFVGVPSPSAVGALQYSSACCIVDDCFTNRFFCDVVWCAVGLSESCCCSGCSMKRKNAL